MAKGLKKVITRIGVSKRKQSATSDHASPSKRQDASGNGLQASFLGLPAEIRNQIYEHLASETQLTLPIVKTKRPPPPIGLLSACRQTYREYRSLLYSTAAFLIPISGYNFGNFVRVLEKLSDEDIAALKLNDNLWIVLQVSHVPTRDDRRNLKGWLDYRSSNDTKPYFGPGRTAANPLVFQYDVKFLTHMRPPRPATRYQNGYQMRLDLLRCHLRMFRAIQPVTEEEPASDELKQLQANLEDLAKILNELQNPSSNAPVRSLSVATDQTLPESE